MKNLVLKFLLYIAIFYSITCVVMFSMQWNILYPAPSDISKLDESRHFIPGLVEYSLELIPGRSIRAFFADSKNGKFIVFYHGNAQNMQSSIRTAYKYYKMGYGVLACSYPGYDGNIGPKRAAAMYKAADACLDLLTKEKSVAESRIILHGYSLGGHMAVHVAQNKPLHSVLLLAPLGSALDIAKANYPILPVSFILTERLISYDKARNIKSPVYIVHNKHDTVVPYSQSLRLYENILIEYKYLHSIDYLMPGDNGHGNLYSYGIKEDIVEWLLSL